MNYIVGVDLLDGMKSLEKHSKQVCFFSIDQIPPFDWFIVIENTLKQYKTNTEGHFVLRIEEPSLMRAEDAHLGCRASHTGNHQVCDELHWYDVWIDMFTIFNKPLNLCQKMMKQVQSECVERAAHVAHIFV